MKNYLRKKDFIIHCIAASKERLWMKLEIDMTKVMSISL